MINRSKCSDRGARVTARPSVFRVGSPGSHRPAWLKRDPEVLLLAGVLALVALLGILGVPAATLSFRPDAVMSGEWWRLFTHPFAHVSLYHLAWDGASFLCLYAALRGLGDGARRAIASAAAVGSLVVAAVSPVFASHGLCGLSGPAHGLMAVYGAQLWLAGRTRGDRYAGAAAVLLTLAKSAYEAVAGHILFSAWHMGFVGAPNAFTHLGGVIGGLAIWIVLTGLSRPATNAAAARLALSRDD